MRSTKIVLKTFPDLIQQHCVFPVDFFEVPIRPVIFNEPVSLSVQLDAFEPIKDRVVGIHGAIYREGVNLLDPDAFEQNTQALNYTIEAAKVFSSHEYVLFHPGHMIANSRCSFDTLFNFLKQFSFPNLMIEFEPFFSYESRLVFPLHHVHDWASFQQKIGLDIVLDTAHCFITSRALQYDFYKYFEALTNTLNPKVIHLSTTNLTDGGVNDLHLPFNQGCIDFKRIAHCFEGRTLVIEVNGVSKLDITFVQMLLQEIGVVV